MEKIPVTDPKAGRPTPLPVKGVDLPVDGDDDIPTPRGNDNEQDFAENEGLVARRLREAEGSLEEIEGEGADAAE